MMSSGGGDTVRSNPRLTGNGRRQHVAHLSVQRRNNWEFLDSMMEGEGSGGGGGGGFKQQRVVSVAIDVDELFSPCTIPVCTRTLVVKDDGVTEITEGDGIGDNDDNDDESPDRPDIITTDNFSKINTTRVISVVTRINHDYDNREERNLLRTYAKISNSMSETNGYVNPEDTFLLTVSHTSHSPLITLTCETFSDPRHIELRLLSPLPIFNSSIGGSREGGRGRLTLDSHRRVVVLPPGGRVEEGGSREVIGVWRKIIGTLNKEVNNSVISQDPGVRRACLDYEDDVIEGARGDRMKIGGWGEKYVEREGGRGEVKSE